MAKRYAYYQPNDKDIKDKMGDCQIRALSKALNLTWLQTFDLITPMCREVQAPDIFCCDLKTTKELMSRIGFEYTGISNKNGSHRPTVEEFTKAHPTGRYVCTIVHHVVAAVDGKYYDTWDCGRKSLYGFYELKG